MSHSAGAPLLGGDHEDDRSDSGSVTSSSLEIPRSPSELREQQLSPQDLGGSGVPGRFVWLLTLSACISGLLFGYDTGVISATLVSIGTSLSSSSPNDQQPEQLTDLDKSIITSCTSLFALIASPLASLLADAVGRKPIILYADILFVVGAVIQAMSRSVSVMVLGRSVVGAAIGAASFVTPLYIAELAPASQRGGLVTMNCLSITFGQVVAYVMGWLLTSGDVMTDGSNGGGDSVGWRWLVGLGVVPAALQCMLLFLMPETPRWLVRAGRSAEARRIIMRTLGGNDSGHVDDEDSSPSQSAADRILREIETEYREEEGESMEDEEGMGGIGGEARSKLGSRGASWRTLRELVMVPKNRRALTIACLLQALQQFCGFNSLMYFSATIFTILGFTMPTLTSLSVAATNFVFTVVALVLIDRIGRRRILIYTIPFMVAGLFLSAYGFSNMKLSPEDASDAPADTTTTDAIGSRDAGIVVLVSIMLYVASYASGLGTVPWMQSELFPMNVRSMGSGLSTAANWGPNFLTGLTFLPFMRALTATWTFVLYGLICVVGWVAIWLIYPETSGLTLEEVSALFEDGWGVK